MMGSTPAAEPINAGTAMKQMLRAWRRHKYLFIGCFLTVTVLGCAAIMSLKPSYTATATVAISPQNSDPLAASDQQSAAVLQDDDFPSTVASMMASRDVAMAVLAQVPPLPETHRFGGIFCRYHVPLLCRHHAAGDPAVQSEWRVDQFLKSLSVMPETHSHVIDVSVSAPTGARAAMLADAVVANYQRLSLAQQAAQSDRVSSWIGNRTVELRQHWLDAVRTANEYNVGHHLTDASNGATTGPLIDQQIGDIAASLEAAQAQLAKGDASSGGGGRLGGGSAIPLSSQPIVVAAADSLLQLESQRDQLAAEFGPKYPKIEALDQQIAAARAELSGHGGDATASTRQNFSATNMQVARLTAQLDQLEAQATAESTEQATFLSLNQEAASAHAAYETFLEHAADVTDQTMLLEPPVTVVSNADLPLRPAFPNQPKLMAGVLFLALVAAAAATLGKDYFSEGYGEAEDLRASVQLPLLATLATVRPLLGRSVANHVMDEPYSRTSEAVRGLGATLALLAPGQPASRVVLVTSAGALDGKSTLAVWLAMTARQTGQKVLLIDGDHRRGTLMQDPTADALRGQGLETRGKPGLTDLLSRDIELKQVIQTDPATDIDYIAAGEAAARSFSARDLGRLRRALTNLKRTYSLIVIDSPPLLAMIDGLVLGSVADQTVFVCRWRQTSRQATTASLDRLKTYGANVAGIVMSMVGDDALTFGTEYSRRESKLITHLYGS